MKKILIFIFVFCATSLGSKAQKVTVTLTDEQYKAVKKQIEKQQKIDKANSYDWAKYKRYAEANSKLTERPRVVFMGNSITDFWASKHPEFFTKHHYLGRGISGQTSCEMLCRFRQDVINIRPKMVVINAGINDIAHNNGVIKLENVFQNIVSMVQLAKANHIRPILTSVLPSNRFSWRPQIDPTESVVSLNKMIKEYAKKNHITYIDYYSVLVDSEKGLPEKYSKDGVHPTAEGYDIMEALVLKTLK
jgi:lysophospholipase L1-like esterase